MLVIASRLPAKHADEPGAFSRQAATAEMRTEICAQVWEKANADVYSDCACVGVKSGLICDAGPISPG